VQLGWMDSSVVAWRARRVYYASVRESSIALDLRSIPSSEADPEAVTISSKLLGSSIRT